MPTRSFVVRAVIVMALWTLACAKPRNSASEAVDAQSADRVGDTQRADARLDGQADLATAGDATSDGVGPVGSAEMGQPCLGGGDCQSGACVDGVCCQSPCTGICLACAESSTGAANGVCAPAMAGLNPHDSCTAGAPEACGNDGTCDGSGACRKYGSNQVCMAAACTGTTFNPARACDGMGTCGPATGADCGAYPCTVAGCAKPCVADTECGAQSFCAAGLCNATKSNGDACATKNECASALCVDGVCCQTACTGPCVSCAEADTGQKSGTCQPVAAGKDPADDCPTDPAAMCGRDGTCDGKGACRKYDAATKCADAVCAGTSFTPARTCANGACAAAAAIDCKQSMCTAAGCQTSCSMDANCATTAYCAGNSCAERKSNGDACTAANQCSSKACVDGVCCESACTGLCYACVTGKTGQASGKCVPVSAGTDLDNECTAQASTTCGTEGTCDGAGACKKWAKGTQCAAGMCNTAGNYLSARTCDGLGTCGAPTTDTCAPNVCGATGCVRTCAKDTDCVGNTYCASGGMCTAKKNAGAACSGAVQCVLGFCVDGVCCNNACSGVCSSCLAKDNGLQADGTCGNVTTGKDPANECAAGSTTCGLDGFCGGGKCRFAPATTSCATAVCANGSNNTSATLTAPKTCDGNGACPSTGSSSACPGNVLCASSSACKSSTCSVDGDCLSGHYCASGTCKAKGALGAACSGTSSGDQCSSNNCSSDLVCCSSACTAGCQGCKSANTGATTGTCATRTTSLTTTCNGTCSGGYFLCGTSSCVRPLWNFDQGAPPASQATTPYGWFYDDIDNEFPTTMITYTSAYSHTGGSNTGSVGLFMDALTEGTGATILFSAPLCDSGMDLHGKTITAWVMRSLASQETSTCEFTLNWNAASASFGGTVNTIGTAAFTWTKITGTVPSTLTGVTKVGITCTWPATTAWTGTLYLDDVSVGP